MSLDRRIAEALDRGEAVGLATVLEVEGSAPAPRGARLALFAGGSRLGTIGGGAPEGRAIDALARGEEGTLELTLDTAEDALALACGGLVRVLLERLAPAQAPLFAATAARLDRGEPIVTALLLERGRAVGRATLDQAGGEPRGEPELESALREAAATGSPVRRSLPSGREALAELLHPRPRLIVAGAGHVGRAAAQVAAAAGFRVTVLDDREPVLAALALPGAEQSPEMHGGPPAGWLLERVPGPADAVLVAMRSLELELETVTAAARSRAFYVGLIGSRSKWRSFQPRVEALAGASGAARVRCPAGLALGGRAPGEIAVGVVAEVLLCWSGRTSPSGTSGAAPPSLSSAPLA